MRLEIPKKSLKIDFVQVERYSIEAGQHLCSIHIERVWSPKTDLIRWAKSENIKITGEVPRTIEGKPRGKTLESDLKSFAHYFIEGTDEQIILARLKFGF